MSKEKKNERLESSRALKTFSELPLYQNENATVSKCYNCGGGLADDKESFTSEDSYLYVISNTDREEYEHFCQRLLSEGFEVADETSLDDNIYRTFVKDGKCYYIYHERGNRVTRVIENNVGALPKTVSYAYEKNPEDKTVLYQYSLNYTNASVPYAEEGSMDCGMLYILRLADGAVFLVDAGHKNQSTASSRRAIYELLREISGCKAGERVRIAGWLFTHAHGDHTELADDFMREYHDKIKVERWLFNFPSYSVMPSGYEGSVHNTKATMRKYFSDAEYVKLHTGQKIRLADVSLEVLYTFEDAVSPDGESLIRDFNASSTVVRLTVDGKGIVLLADISGVSENIIMSNYSESFLKSDAVQMSHHSFNSLKRLYSAIGAETVLVPQSYNNAYAHTTEMGEVMLYAKSGIYCADAYTYGFEIVDGCLVMTERLERYDATTE